MILKKYIKFQFNRIHIIGVLLIIVVLVFMFGNAFLYKDTVVRVTKVDNTFEYEEYGPNDEVERYYSQEIIATILNGNRKGDTVSLDNTYSSSGINDERYRKGEQLFISVSGESEHGQIKGKKRDWHLAFLICVFVGLLLFMNKKQGFCIAVTLLVNILVFVIALQYYGQGADLVKTAFGLMIFFSILTLLFAGGFHRKTFVAIVATLITTLLCYGIYETVLRCNERLSYEMMDYVVNPTDLPELFLTGVLMGSLGAVMDVAISIAAGVAEIKQQTPEISTKSLISSIREMGYDIMGTMVNVLFFTYMSGSVSVVIIKIMNGYTLYHLVHFQLMFEIIRFLVGAIGIVLAIPVSGACAVVLLHIWTPAERKVSSK